MKGMKLDQRFRELGNRVIVVNDFKQFIDRLTNAANNIDAALEHQRVEYKKSGTLSGLHHLINSMNLSGNMSTGLYWSFLILTQKQKMRPSY